MSIKTRVTAVLCIVLMAVSALSLPTYAFAAGSAKPAATASAKKADKASKEKKKKKADKSSKEKKKKKADKSAKKKKGGNCDHYIGLDEEWLVLATAKRYVKVYKSKSTKSKELGHFSKNNCIEVATDKLKKGKNYKWLPVYLEKRKIGYVRRNYVSLGKLNIENFGLEPKGKNKKRIEICKYGIPYIGVRFRLGCTSLKTGIDCSNFVKQAMHHAGVKCSGFAVDLSQQGKKISRKQLKPGDTLYYYNNPHDLRIGHSAIYVGGCGMAPGEGYIINASGHQGNNYPSGGLRFSRIDYRTPTAVRFRNFVGN